MTLTRLGVIALVLLGCSTAQAGDWSRFRGPNGTGVSGDSESTPTKWSPKEHVKWKAKLPGAGVSSPIVVGDRVFVTCYSGYGVDRRNPGEMENLKRHLVCIDATSGKTIWDKTVDAVLPEDPFSGMGIPAHGYASHSPVSDGEKVFVFFGKTGALAFDMDGKQLWKKSLGTESDRRLWGSASSPIVHDNLVIVTASAESEALVALDKETGKEVWRQEAAGFGNVWGTPALVKIDDKRTDVVLGVPYEIWGFNPATGKLRWYAEAMNTDSFNSSVVVHDGVVFAIEGRGGGSIAVKAGGSGDVTDSHVVWNGRDSSRFGTPVAYQGRLYFVSGGVVNCIDAKTGDRVFQSRLQAADAGSAPAPEEDREQGRPDRGRGGSGQGGFGQGGFGQGGFGQGGFGRGGFGRGGRGGGSDYASPVIADGKLYYVKASGEVYVLKAGEKFEQLAVNRVTEDRETFSATPAISKGRLFLRSDKHLYCVGEDK